MAGIEKMNVTHESSNHLKACTYYSHCDKERRSLPTFAIIFFLSQVFRQLYTTKRDSVHSSISHWLFCSFYGNHLVLKQRSKHTRGSEQMPGRNNEAVSIGECTGLDLGPSHWENNLTHQFLRNPSLNKQVGPLTYRLKVITEASQAHQADQLLLSGHWMGL